MKFLIAVLFGVNVATATTVSRIEEDRDFEALPALISEAPTDDILTEDEVVINDADRTVFELLDIYEPLVVDEYWRYYDLILGAMLGLW